MQMLFANVLIDAVDTTLEDREVSLGIVSVSIASDVFILRMNNSPMAGKFLTGFPIDNRFRQCEDDEALSIPASRIGPEVRGIHFPHMVRADTPSRSTSETTAFLGLAPYMRGSELPADEKFRLPQRTRLHRRAVRMIGVRHRLANAHRHEPCRLVGDPECAMQLMRRNAFLARRHQTEGEQPLVDRNMRALEIEPTRTVNCLGRRRSNTSPAPSKDRRAALPYRRRRIVDRRGHPASVSLQGKPERHPHRGRRGRNAVRGFARPISLILSQVYNCQVRRHCRAWRWRAVGAHDLALLVASRAALGVELRGRELEFA